MRHNLAYVLLDPEPDNFTYELDNEQELADWVARVSGREAAEVDVVLAEARGDRVLTDRLRAATAGRWWWSKPQPPFGKRLAWYALARLLKPALIVETGVHDGLGSLLLLRALERNALEGASGRLVSFDVNPAAGGWPGPIRAGSCGSSPAETDCRRYCSDPTGWDCSSTTASTPTSTSAGSCGPLRPTWPQGGCSSPTTCTSPRR